jgi:isohexenylglutaconyl-CoA hydratase
MPRLRLDFSGPHLTITLDDPRRQNALSADMVAEIDAALDDSRARGLASLTIAGANGVFSAGADLKSLSAGLAQSPAPGEADPLRDQNRAGGHFYA